MAEFADPGRSARLVRLLAPERKTRIVDIGANPINDNPYAGLLAIGACEVWGFEPQKDAYDQLVARDAPDEHYFNAAVGKGGKASLNICASSGTTSLLQPNRDALDFIGGWHKYFEVVATEEIKTRRLDDFKDIPAFDLLKIDVQGAEVEIFKSGKAKLREALAVVTEVAAIPLYRDQPLLGHQMLALGELGYHLHKFLFFKDIPLRSDYLEGLRPRRMRSQLVDGDAVFIRDMLHVSAMQTETLKHLAILADTVFESFDLALYCLEFLVERGAIAAPDVAGYVAALPFQKPDRGAVRA
jgi:FkbM family methyltransferase